MRLTLILVCALVFANAAFAQPSASTAACDFVHEPWFDWPDWFSEADLQEVVVPLVMENNNKPDVDDGRKLCFGKEQSLHFLFIATSTKWSATASRVYNLCTPMTFTKSCVPVLQLLTISINGVALSTLESE
jgi:hypothetical protein